MARVCMVHLYCKEILPCGNEFCSGVYIIMGMLWVDDVTRSRSVVHANYRDYVSQEV